MYCGDAPHAVVVGKKCGHVGEAAAVSCVHNEDKAKHKGDEDHIACAVFYALCEDDKCGEYDGKAEYELVDGVSVLQGVSPCGEAQTAACVEYGGYGGDDARRSRKAYALDDHLLL